MSQVPNAVVLFALLLLPIGIFLIVRATVDRVPLRACLALLIALMAGGASYYLAAEYGWRPSLKSGPLNLDPLMLGTGHFILMLVVFTILNSRLGRARTKKASRP